MSGKLNREEVEQEMRRAASQTAWLIVLALGIVGAMVAAAWAMTGGAR